MTPTIPEMPALEIDAHFRSTGWRPNADHLIERQIVWALLHAMAATHPDRTLLVFDGEENVACGDAQAAMEVIFNLDTAWLRMGRDWVMLIMGNGIDIISDYGVNPATEAAVEAAMAACGID